MFELEKDAVKKVNNHTFEFADVVAGNIANKEGKVIGVMTVDDITKEGETEVISKRIEVVWVPSMTILKINKPSIRRCTMVHLFISRL